MDKPFINKLAIITGGGSGIGKALAMDLAKQGARIEIYGHRLEPLVAVCDLINQEIGPGVCGYTVGDVSVPADVDSFAEKIMASHASVDIVINSAGWISESKTVEETSVEDFDRSFATNVRSIFLFTKKFLPLMEKQGAGTIVNITSAAGIYGNPLIPIYSASKFAARGLTQAIGKSLPEGNIHYFSVAPSGTNTPMRKKVFGAEDAAKQQSAETVAQVVIDAILRRLDVHNGGEVVVRDGKVTEINNPLRK